MCVLRRLLLLALTSTAVLAAPPAPAAERERVSQRIVGGSETTIEQYPYMSNMLFFRNNAVWTQWCGGALLTSQTILSAAHCYRQTSPFQWRVRLGSSYTFSDDGSTFNVLQFISHQLFNEVTSDNDIAIVRLASAATLGGSIGVVSIASADYHLPAETPVTFVGWGVTSAGGVLGSNVLRHVDVGILDQQTCVDTYADLSYVPNVNENMVCAGILGSTGGDACQGDSGGPVIYKSANGPVVYGVVSWGLICDHPIYPGVNTRVSRYTDWIIANGSS